MACFILAYFIFFCHHRPKAAVTIIIIASGHQRVQSAT
jgi:hypothetical protein